MERPGPGTDREQDHAMVRGFSLQLCSAWDDSGKLTFAGLDQREHLWKYILRVTGRMPKSTLWF